MTCGMLRTTALLLCLLPGGAALAQTAPAHALAGEAPAEIRTRYLLVGPDGGAVSDEDFRGRFQLLTFGYTFCPDICPTTLVEMAEVLRLLEDRADSVQVLFISVDPERDTPQALAAYTRFFDKRILGLTGSADLIQRVAKNFRIRYAKVPDRGGAANLYSVDHSSGIYLLGRSGEFIKKFGYGAPPSQIAAEIRALAGD